MFRDVKLYENYDEDLKTYIFWWLSCVYFLNINFGIYQKIQWTLHNLTYLPLFENVIENGILIERIINFIEQNVVLFWFNIIFYTQYMNCLQLIWLQGNINCINKIAWKMAWPWFIKNKIERFFSNKLLCSKYNISFTG